MIQSEFVSIFILDGMTVAQYISPYLVHMTYLIKICICTIVILYSNLMFFIATSFLGCYCDMSISNSLPSSQSVSLITSRKNYEHLYCRVKIAKNYVYNRFPRLSLSIRAINLRWHSSKLILLVGIYGLQSMTDLCCRSGFRI